MIIEANGKFYTTTMHTDEKMFVEDITAAKIKLTIEQGTSDLTRDGNDIYRLSIEGQVIAVIIATDERIVTVFTVK